MSSARRTDIALLLLRLAFGGTMVLFHGWPKLERILAGDPKFGDPIGLGPELSLYLVTFAEFLCAILVTLGLFTRLALLPLIFAMGVAFFVAHWGDPFNKMYGSFSYLISFIALLLTGPGRYSLDEQWRIRGI